MLEIILGLVLLAYILVDVNYFLRIIVLYVVNLYFRPKISVLDTSTVYGITLFSDVDQLLDHMNNARLLREFDYGRIDYGIRTGAMAKIFPKGGAFPINANYIRYRLPVKLFSIYKVETRALAWNEKTMFLEQKLITLRDGIVRAVAYPKAFCYKFSANELVEELLPGTISPELEPRLQKINEIGDITSEILKSEKTFADNMRKQKSDAHSNNGYLSNNCEKNR